MREHPELPGVRPLGGGPGQYRWEFGERVRHEEDGDGGDGECRGRTSTRARLGAAWNVATETAEFTPASAAVVLALARPSPPAS